MFRFAKLSEEKPLILEEKSPGFWKGKAPDTRRKTGPEYWKTDESMLGKTKSNISLEYWKDSQKEGNEVAIFKDRIEIYNPGQFPEGYTPKDFIKGTERSILRNPLIANTLYLSKDIERWGSGLKRIYNTCKKADVRIKFEKLKSGFLVIFYRKTEWEAEKVGEKVGENEAKILDLISQNKNITYVELANKLGIAEKNIYKNIEKLKQKGLLKRIGPAKGGYWKVIK